MEMKVWFWLDFMSQSLSLSYELCDIEAFETEEWHDQISLQIGHS